MNFWQGITEKLLGDSASESKSSPLFFFNSEKEDLWDMGEGEVSSTLTSIPFARPLVKCERGGGGGASHKYHRGYCSVSY